MTVQERLEDISRRTGVSVGQVKRVLDTSRESIIESLGRGERATLPGIATFRMGKKRTDPSQERVLVKPSTRVEVGAIDSLYKNIAEGVDIDKSDRIGIVEGLM